MKPFAEHPGRGVALLSALCASVAFGQVNVLENRYTPGKTSANLNETVLNTANVNTTTFGKLGSYFVDGVIFAQPLYAQGVTVNGATHNVLYIATMHDVVYAFDADKVGSLPLWTVDFRNLAQGIAPAPVHIGTTDGTDGGIADTLGILATPVIDLPNNRMFVVTDTLENGTEFFRLRSIDIRSGALLGSTAITGSLPASGSLPAISFIPSKYGQRVALEVADGQVWVPFTSRPSGDYTNPWQGWLMTYNPNTLAQTGAFASSRTNGNSFWQSGAGPAVDGNGNVYYLTGNGGNYDPASEYPMSLLKLNFGSGLTLNDWYTPDNPNGDDYFAALNSYDADLGVNGPMLIPGTDLVIFGSKTGDVYLLHTSNLGKLTPNDTQLAQFFHVGAPTPYTEPMFWSDRLVGMTFWQNAAGVGTLYAWPGLDSLHAYTLNTASSTFTQSFAGTYDLPGQPSTALSISASGTTAGSAILWAPTTAQTKQANGVGQPGELHAYDAANPGHELWNSQMATSDYMGTLAKWVPVTVANGKVYVANSAFVGNYGDGSVVVYGLKSNLSSHVPPYVSLAAPIDGYTSVSGNAINITTYAYPNSSALTTVSFVDGTQVLATVNANASTHLYSYTWAGAPQGIHTITARAVDTTGAVTVSPAVTINVIGTPTYSVSASPAAVVLPPGGTVVATITVTPLSGFSGPPGLGGIGSYPGVTGIIAKTSNPNVFTITLSALPTTAPGAYPLILNTGAGGQPNALSLPVTIAKTGVTTGPNTFTVSAPGGTLGTPVVFTEGAPSSSLGSPDFTLIAAGTTCTGAVSGTCTVSIQFTPQFGGLRRGAFKLVDTSNNVLATYYFSGTGAGAAPVFSGSATPAVTPIYSPSIGYPFGVAVDAAGNSFVVDVYNNQVLKVTPNKAVTVVPLGTTLNAPYDVKLDAAGNLYIADAGNNRILKLPYGSSAASGLTITGLNHPEGVAVDGAGNIFVANTRAVVTGGTGNIIELTASGTQSTLSATGLKFPSTIAIDAVGDVFIADTYNNRVLELPASGLPVTIGTGLSLAAAVAVDAAGDVFIADRNNGRVVEVPATLNGPGTGTQITLATGLLMPTALALDGKGDLFVANIGTSGTGGTSVSGNVVELQTANTTQTISFNAIPPQNLGTSPTLTATASSGLTVSFSSYTPSVCTVSGSTATLLQSGTCTILASQLGGGAYLPAPGVVRSFTVLSAGGTLTTTFSVPAGITLGTPQVFTEGVPSTALSSRDFQLVASGTTCIGVVSGTCTVNVKFTPVYAGLRRGAVKLVDTQNNLVATGYISGIGANSQAAFTPGAVQKLWASGAVPGVTVDGAGNIYFVTGSAQIYNTKNGNFNLMSLGTTLNSPFGLALDGAGNLYICDSGNNRVLELPYGSTTAVALNVTGLNYPQGVAVDGQGNIFIANTRGTASTGNGTVIELASGSGAQSTVIGTGLGYPVGITFDSSGDLFVADWGESHVLELSISGESTFIGTGLANASAVGVDALGDVFIADQNNNRLVEVPGTASGPGTGTQVTIATGLLQPHGMVLDGPGNVYVSDLGTATTFGNLAKVPNQ